MLVALILLLHDFNQIGPLSQMGLDPWKTDVLVNLIVIFSKIVKQSPELCTELASALGHILACRDEQNEGFHRTYYEMELFFQLDLNPALFDVHGPPEQHELEQSPE